MSDLNLPLTQQSAYQRWEMSSFTADKKLFHDVNKRDTPEPDAYNANAKVSAQFKVAFEEARKQGYIKGMQEGVAAALKEADATLQTEKRAFTGLIAQLHNALDDIDKVVAHQVMGLALDVAKAMLKTELNVNHAAILPIVQDALSSLLINQKPARLVLSSRDARMVQQHLANELVERDWHVIEDPSMENGDCFIETASNQLDATNQVRWKKICEALGEQNVWNEAV